MGEGISEKSLEINDDTRDVCYDKSERNKLNLTVLNTNARSLCPKIGSLVDCFSELKAAIGVVTETWLADGVSLQEDIETWP